MNDNATGGGGQVVSVVVIDNSPVRVAESAEDARDWVANQEFTKYQQEAVHIHTDVPFETERDHA